jgi:NodT family efflux transporter outer membrane factor (OMF) lipoprotein
MTLPFIQAPFVRKTVAACVASACAACSTLPHYTQPTASVPDHFAGSPVQATPGWRAASPADNVARGPWWTLYNDEPLNRLEAQIDVSNQTVKKAVTQLESARSMVDYQRAGYFPLVTAGASAERFRTSKNILYRGAAGHTIPDFSTGLSASWEPDLFGKIKDATVNARDNAQASEADLEGVKLAVSTELATDYFDLRALDIQKKLLDDTVKAYAAALAIVQQQLNDGAIDASAVAQAETQLESARTQDTDIDAQRTQLEHAIATLIGVPASSFSLPVATTPLAVPSIPTGLPSQLLERRPDIAAAERRVAAANAQIGEAHAAYYPSLTLAASAGLESSSFGPWLTAPSLFWALGSQLAGTIFDGGQRKAMVKGATAQFKGTVADYRQTVLVAFQQVEDQLTMLNALASEEQTQQRATDAAKLSLTLTTNRYQAGAVNYLEVVTAQTIALYNERTLDQIDARRADASVLLLKALGGGWQRSSLTDAKATD